MMEKIGEYIHLFIGRKLPNASGPTNMTIVVTIELYICANLHRQLLLLVSPGCSLYENIESLYVCMSSIL